MERALLVALAETSCCNPLEIVSIRLPVKLERQRPELVVSDVQLLKCAQLRYLHKNETRQAEANMSSN
eukprot:228781-Pleurochrysis_carterae.AAC.2